MTSTDRIARHRETIARIREDIVWVSETSFSMSAKPGETTEALIAQQKAIIQMYEGFIANLEGLMPSGPKG